MVSRSPDTDAAERRKAEQLKKLRSAVAEIDQRHAEGESFFGDTLGRTSDRGDDEAQAPEAQTPVVRTPAARSRSEGSRKSSTSATSGRGRTSRGGTGRGGLGRSASGRRTSSRWKPAKQAEANPFDGDLSDAPDFALGDDDSTPDWIVALAADSGDESDASSFEDSSTRGSSSTGASFEDSSFEDDEPEPPDFDESYAKAKKTAMNMLAMRDHSRDELRKKLLKREYLDEAVELLLDKLERSRLLNDEEFAQHFARAQRESRKLSRGALKRELKKKGISQEIIAETIENVDGEEELARAVAEKKARSTRGLDRQVRERRILGMLARRGFASSICFKVTKEVLAET